MSSLKRGHLSWALNEGRDSGLDLGEEHANQQEQQRQWLRVRNECDVFEEQLKDVRANKLEGQNGKRRRGKHQITSLWSLKLILVLVPRFFSCFSCYYSASFADPVLHSSFMYWCLIRLYPQPSFLLSGHTVPGWDTEQLPYKSSWLWLLKIPYSFC